MKRIIIIGNANSIWIKNLVMNINDSDFCITVISKDNQLFREFYANNNINIYYPKLNKFIAKIPKVGGLYSYIKISNYINKSNCDYVNFQFATYDALKLSMFIKNAKIIISYWGSDLLRASKKNLTRCYRYLAKSYKITMETDYVIQKFESIYGNVFSHKIEKITFGMNGFESIDKIRFDKSKSKSIYNLPKDKIIIAIGYNRIRQQQHIEVFKQIKVLPKNVKDKIFIVLPMTYGFFDDNYVEKVKEEVGLIGVSGYKIFENFLSEMEMAHLCNACDIFIHAQTTDTLSSTVQEQLYCGNYVLNPSWIEYPELVYNNVYFEKYGSFEELNNLILYYLNNKDLIIEKCMYNHDILFKKYSWSIVAVEWKKRVFG